MSIDYEFTPHNTIVVECGGQVIEVALPQPAAPARGGPVGMAPSSPLAGRPKQGPGVMAIITSKKTRTNELDWTRFDPEVKLESLDKICNMDDGQLNQFIVRQGSNLDVGSTLKVLDVGVTPWSGTTPFQLQKLRSIVEDDAFDLDGVRLFRMSDDQR
ncbi:MAG: hypothetical protein JWQ33_1031 [Ramlibacter sp.]|nr:hypothetical protein [Ramlibacter sp.]